MDNKVIIFGQEYEIISVDEFEDINKCEECSFCNFDCTIGNKSLCRIVSSPLYDVFLIKCED